MITFKEGPGVPRQGHFHQLSLHDLPGLSLRLNAYSKKSADVCCVAVALFIFSMPAWLEIIKTAGGRVFKKLMTHPKK